MTEHELDALVARTARITDGEAAGLAIDDGAADLREAVMSHRAEATPARARVPAAPPPPPAARASRGRGTRAPSPARRRLAGLALVAGLVVAAVLTGVLRGGPADDGTAWAAPLVRLAESSPLLLLDEPGWSVTRADEYAEDEGEMTFTAEGRTADLHWRDGPLRRWQTDRAHDASVVETHEVLGAPAQVSSYSDREFTALWQRRGRVLEFRTSAGGDLAGFVRLLRRLTPVSVDRWLGAMPASVVQRAGRAQTIRGMLAGVSLPPGLDLRRLEERRQLEGRYALGADVTRLVACRWSKLWRARTRSGDEAGAAEAEQAMATAGRWPILREMARTGDWPRVIEGIAPAMRREDTPYVRSTVARGITPEFCGVPFPQG
jgi:hypothetical protein